MAKADHHLVVLGTARGQGRPRATTRGKFASVYEDKKDKQAKETLVAVVQQNAPDTLLDGPLRVDLFYFFMRPKGHFGSGKNAGNIKASAQKHKTSKPDVDNLAKLTLDALTGIFWRDDAQICRCFIVKAYSDKPRTEIFIRKLR